MTTTKNQSIAPLEKLLSGVRHFRRNIFPEQRQTLEKTFQDGQKPHTLFITCADSRVDPEGLTQSDPGEIFVTRNVGNIVPAYGQMLGGVSAVVEYAVSALGVEQIIVCGHTDCGAMSALLNPESLESLPTVRQWMCNSEAARSVSNALAPEGADRHTMLNLLAEQNVMLQLQHLRTHPSVAGQIAHKKLSLYGWVYELEHGSVRIWDEDESRFLPLD